MAGQDGIRGFVIVATVLALLVVATALVGGLQGPAGMRHGVHGEPFIDWGAMNGAGTGALCAGPNPDPARCGRQPR